MKKALITALMVIAIALSSATAQQFWASPLNRHAYDIAVRKLPVIKPKNDTILTIIDYTLPSTAKRLFVLDLKNKEILLYTYVAHGMGSGENYVLSFSNAHGSHASSPGFYLTGNTYEGKHGYTLKLTGLEPGINDNATARAIVIHGAWYVSEDFIRKNGRLGRSWGCPAVEEYLVDTLINLIKDGSVLFIYTCDTAYYKHSSFYVGQCKKNNLQSNAINNNRQKSKIKLKNISI